MMYSNKLAVAVKVDGKVLREFKDAEGTTAVYVPFGTEYSILLKNLNNVRARVSVHIDGTPVGGSPSSEMRFVVDAGHDLTLERFVTSASMSTGNRFKFIERTEKIEQYRGIHVDDGLIRVEVEYEQPMSQQREMFWAAIARHADIANETKPSTVTNYPYIHDWSSSIGGGTGSPSVFLNCATNCADTGITVPGSISTQKFEYAQMFVPDGQPSTVMVIALKGATAEAEVKAPVDTSRRLVCSSCGTKNKPSSKFCTECGTALVVPVDTLPPTPYQASYRAGWNAHRCGDQLPSVFAEGVDVSGFTRGYRDSKNKRKRLY